MLNNTGIWVIIPNWNGGKLLPDCLKSLAKQTEEHTVVLVDNASGDNSVELVEKSFPYVDVIRNEKNLGFAGGVNAGIKHALDNDAKYVVLLNNDVKLEKDWLSELKKTLAKHKQTGSATGKLLSADGKKVDNTGDEYSIWGLTMPRQRGLPAKEALAEAGEVFGACAGAAMYRASAMKEVGFFDEKFFAYYEDTDFNFRLQLAGWKAFYNPLAVGYHATGSTSSKIPGFITLQTMKNTPILFWKNVPLSLIPKIFPRFFLAHVLVFFSSIFKGRGTPAIKGALLGFGNIPHTLIERRKIQKNRKVSNEYIWSILYHDMPPNARRLRRLRSFFGRQRIPGSDNQTS